MSNEYAFFVTNFSVTILTDSLLFKITQVVDCLRCFKSESSKKESSKQKEQLKFILIGTCPFRIFLMIPIFSLEVAYS